MFMYPGTQASTEPLGFWLAQCVWDGCTLLITMLLFFFFGIFVFYYYVLFLLFFCFFLPRCKLFRKKFTTASPSSPNDIYSKWAMINEWNKLCTFLSPPTPRTHQHHHRHRHHIKERRQAGVGMRAFPLVSCLSSGEKSRYKSSLFPWIIYAKC